MNPPRRGKPERINNLIVGIGSKIAAPPVSIYAPYFPYNMPENTPKEKAAKQKKPEKSSLRISNPG